jgi:hypothetical protein
MSTTTRRVLTVATALVLMLSTTAGASGEQFTSPLFGLDVAPNGDLLVADAGAGVHVFSNGTIERTIALPGVTDISSLGVGSMWATTTGEDPEADSGQGLWRVSNGRTHLVANLYAFEDANDPDGAGVDSNPFDVQSLGGNAALVIDSGGNDLLKVDRRGGIHLMAVFPDEVVSTNDLKTQAGCPFGPPFVCELPDALPAQAVPTSVAIGPDGWYYVGELKGFPAPFNESRIWRVSPNASAANCPDTDCQLVFNGGFTSIIDLAFDGDGNLLVAELDEASWAAVEIFMAPTGGTVNSCDVATKTCAVVASGIPILTAIAGDGALWATEYALIPGLADVIELP